jgi:hypothetical protein
MISSALCNTMIGGAFDGDIRSCLVQRTNLYQLAMISSAHCTTMIGGAFAGGHPVIHCIAYCGTAIGV